MHTTNVMEPVFSRRIRSLAAAAAGISFAAAARADGTLPQSFDLSAFSGGILIDPTNHAAVDSSAGTDSNFQLAFSFGAASVAGFRVNVSAINGYQWLDSGNLTQLPASSVVDENSGSYSANSIFYVDAPGVTNIPNDGSTFYFGVRQLLDSNYYYGWLGLSYSGSVLTLSDIEMSPLANQAVTTGVTPIPEPLTSGLLMGAAVMAALFARRFGVRKLRLFKPSAA